MAEEEEEIEQEKAQKIGLKKEEEVQKEEE